MFFYFRGLFCCPRIVVFIISVSGTVMCVPHSHMSKEAEEKRISKQDIKTPSEMEVAPHYLLLALLTLLPPLTLLTQPINSLEATWIYKKFPVAN